MPLYLVPGADILRTNMGTGSIKQWIWIFGLSNAIAVVSHVCFIFNRPLIHDFSDEGDMFFSD